MKFQKKKDIKKREFYSKYEMKRIYSKYLLSQTEALTATPPRKVTIVASSKLEALESVKDLQEGVFVLSSTWRERLKKSYKVPRQGSKVRLRGRCLRTNRARSVSQLLRISRQECRRLALDGQIPGVTRST